MPENICFIISRIGADGSPERIEANRVRDEIIKPAVEKFGYTAVRADDLSEPGMITTDIIDLLLNAPLVVADLSGKNPNVFYELAVRHATRKPIITISTQEDNNPFDVYDVRTVFYDLGKDDGVENCIRAIEQQVQIIEERVKIGNGNIATPISIAIDIQEMRRTHDPIEQRYDLIADQMSELNRKIKKLKKRIPYKSMIDDYRAEIDTLSSLRDAGIIKTFRHRDVALKDFESAIDEENSEIMVIGSSLLGLLIKDQYKEFKEKLKAKINTDCQVKFLLTHPSVADLRAEQEARRFREIGEEIITSLRELQKWGVEAKNVRLYKGTPTIFAVKTRKKMLLNPYAYGAEAFNSPCLIVRNDPERYCYFYDEYDKAHFGAWDTNTAEKIDDLGGKIAELEGNLDEYTENIKTILGDKTD